jgi:orotate phosphoribosyltransferase
MDTLTEEFLIRFYELGGFRIGNFKLKLHEKNPEAPLSPFYIDFRLLRSDPYLLYQSADLYLTLIKKNFPNLPDLLADIPTASTPSVTLLGQSLSLPIISPRMDNKEYGHGQGVDGISHIIRANSTVVVCDDLITKADSKFKAIDRIEGFDVYSFKVLGLVVLLDREQGGRKNLMEKGYQCEACFTITDMLTFYRDRHISESDYFKCMNYLGFGGRPDGVR